MHGEGFSCGTTLAVANLPRSTRSAYGGVRTNARESHVSDEWLSSSRSSSNLIVSWRGCVKGQPFQFVQGLPRRVLPGCPAVY